MFKVLYIPAAAARIMGRTVPETFASLHLYGSNTAHAILSVIAIGIKGTSQVKVIFAISATIPFTAGNIINIKKMTPDICR